MAPGAIASETVHSGRCTHEGVEACVLTSSIPVGRCVGGLWVAYWACQIYHLLCVSQQLVSTQVLYN